MDLTVFDSFPEPVFYIEDGKICYSNPSALALEPEWTAGCAVPAPLALEPDGEGVFSCVLGGRRFQAAATKAGNGLLLTLRNPVRAQMGNPAELPVHLRETVNNVQAALRMLAPMVEEQGEESGGRNLAVLNQNCYRLLRLARHLEMAQKTENPSALREGPVDLAELCRGVVYEASGLAERTGVEFSGEVPGGVISTVADRELLETMLLELISNALKAAGKGGKAGLRLTSNGKRVLITVWDDGPGMSQAELTALTDGDAPESLPKPGTGLRLGMPIARFAAEAHGGAVLLESQEGQGLRVTASLPMKKPVKGKLYTPQPAAEEDFSLSMTLLSDALSWQAFEE